MSVTDSSEKINPVRDRDGSQRPSVSNRVKQFIQSERGNDILLIFIVILVALGSFELGRLSKSNSGSGIKLDYTAQEANSISGAENVSIINKIITPANRNFFASSKGSKYYPSGCPAGQNIKPENKIYFSTSAEAERAGYSLSSSCN